MKRFMCAFGCPSHRPNRSAERHGRTLSLPRLHLHTFGVQSREIIANRFHRKPNRTVPFGKSDTISLSSIKRSSRNHRFHRRFMVVTLVYGAHFPNIGRSFGRSLTPLVERDVSMTFGTALASVIDATVCLSRNIVEADWRRGSLWPDQISHPSVPPDAWPVVDETVPTSSCWPKYPAFLSGHPTD